MGGRGLGAVSARRTEDPGLERASSATRILTVAVLAAGLLVVPVAGSSAQPTRPLSVSPQAASVGEQVSLAAEPTSLPPVGCRISLVGQGASRPLSPEDGACAPDGQGQLAETVTVPRAPAGNYVLRVEVDCGEFCDGLPPTGFEGHFTIVTAVVASPDTGTPSVGTDVQDEDPAAGAGPVGPAPSAPSEPDPSELGPMETVRDEAGFPSWLLAALLGLVVLAATVLARFLRASGRHGPEWVAQHLSARARPDRAPMAATVTETPGEGPPTRRLRIVPGPHTSAYQIDERASS